MKNAVNIYRDKYGLFKFTTAVPVDWERDENGKQVVDDKGRSKKVERDYVNIEDLSIEIDVVNATVVMGEVVYDIFRNPDTKTITDNTGKEAPAHIRRAVERYEAEFGVVYGDKALIRE